MLRKEELGQKKGLAISPSALRVEIGTASHHLEFHFYTYCPQIVSKEGFKKKG